MKTIIYSVKPEVDSVCLFVSIVGVDFGMREDEIGARREKMESKGAYAHDLHEAIRDVRRAFTKSDLQKISKCLNALRDICAPEIREAIQGEWAKIDDKYHDNLKRVNNADFVADRFTKHNGWETDYEGNEVYYIPYSGILTQSGEAKLERDTRNKFLFEIWDKILHERFQVCIDCLDRHGELRKWRDVEYGKL